MSLELKIIALAKAIGNDVRDLNVSVGDLSSLPTTAKSSLVASLVELNALVNDTQANLDDKIDDTAGALVTDKAWSSSKILEHVASATAALRNELVDGAGDALDTFKEFAEAIGNDPNFAATLAEQIGNRVRFDKAQTITAAQKKIACINIGVGDPEHDYVADYVAAKV